MRSIRHVLVYLVIGVCCSIACPPVVCASVVLNEVAIQPNQVVELYNTSSESADISSWYIDDSGGTTYYTIPTNTRIASHSCLLFSSDFNLNKSSADIIRLFDNTSPPTTISANLVEQYSYTKAPELNYSFSKKIDGEGVWQTAQSSLGLSNVSLLSCIASPAPTPPPTETPFPLPSLYVSPTATTLPMNTPVPTNSPTLPIEYQNIYISEVYPNPQSNEQEWVELYNDNSIQVHLIEWYIDDGENVGSTPKIFSLSIEPYRYAVVDLTSSLFNNDGDTVRLLDNKKYEKDSMEYGKITRGKSIARTSFIEDLYCIQDSTKAHPNSSCISEKKDIVNQNEQLQINRIIPIMTPIRNTQSVVRLKQGNLSLSPIAGGSQSTQEGMILGATTRHQSSIHIESYLSFISFSYSLLTIVSVFTKMRNAYS